MAFSLRDEVFLWILMKSKFSSQEWIWVREEESQNVFKTCRLMALWCRNSERRVFWVQQRNSWDFEKGCQGNKEILELLCLFLNVFCISITVLVLGVVKRQRIRKKSCNPTKDFSFSSIFLQPTFLFYVSCMSALAQHPAWESYLGWIFN